MDTAAVGNPAGSGTAKTLRILDLGTTLFLFLFVLLLPVSIAAAYIAYSGAALAWILRLAWGRGKMLHRSPLDLPILIYWLLCTASAIHSPLPLSSWEGMRKVNLVFLAILVAHNVPTPKRAKQLISVLFLGALVSVAFAAWQMTAGVGLHVSDVNPRGVFYQSGIRDGDVILRVDGRIIRDPGQFLNYLTAIPEGQTVRMRVVNDSGFDVLKDARSVAVTGAALNGRNLGMKVERERLERARAFYSHPVSYGMALESLACLAFGLWLGFGARRTTPAGLGLLALWLILALALGATLTRSAMLAFALGCLFMAWLHERRRWVRFSLPAFLAAATLATEVAVRHWRGMGLLALHDQGTQYRLLMWRDGLRLIEAHPWFGVGMNTVRDAWWKFNLVAYNKFHLHSHFHSTPIQLAVMQGIPVLLAWLGLLATFWFMLLRMVKTARECHSPLIYGLAMGILGATTAFLASSVVQYNFGDSVVVLQFWLLAGIALALERQLRMQTASPPASPGVPAAGLARDG
jgi:O-antigen ligase